MTDKRNSRLLSSKAKEIVYNTSEYFSKDEQGSQFLQRTAAATGISRSTVVRIRKEKKNTGALLSPQRLKRTPYKDVDSFDKSVIRNKIAEFYTVRKQLPTIHALHSILRAEIQFPGSAQTLRKMVKHMGYKWTKTRDNRKVLIERPQIVAQRLAFYKRKKELEEQGFELVFIDETWIDTAYTAKKCWQGDNTPKVVPPCNRGQRIIVVHASCRHGFLPGALLIYTASSTTGDYHSEMDGKNFSKWVEEMRIPNLDQPSAVVMDNASYHSMKRDKCPTSTTRKADIQDWLRNHGVSFTEDMLRPQLLELARINKPPPTYTIDELLRYHGHEVLRLPPYHPDFNAIEMIWGQMKSIVRQRNVTFRYDDVLQTTKTAFDEISPERWRRVCDHVRQHVEDCKTSDHYVDEQMDALVIDMRDDTSSSSSDVDDQ